MKSEVHLIDCMEFMRSVPDKFYSLCVTDPPYGIGINISMGRRKGDKKSDYHKFAGNDLEIPPAEYFKELRRISVNQIIWGGNYMTQYLPPSPCWLLWDKGFSEEVTFAQFEMAWTSFNSSAKKFDKHPVDINRIHPTQKPVALYDWIFKNYAKPNDTILDTHMGSQSSRISAYKAGLDYTGCELDPEYFEQGNERFRQFLLNYGTPDPEKAIHGQQINLF
jgi:site-specific DNA-methyltransferase (adenine-specific)